MKNRMALFATVRNWITLASLNLQDVTPADIHRFGSLMIHIGKQQKSNDPIFFHNKKSVMSMRDEEMETFGHEIRFADEISF